MPYATEISPSTDSSVVPEQQEILPQEVEDTDQGVGNSAEGDTKGDGGGLA